MLSDVANIHEGSRFRIKDQEKARVYEAIVLNSGCSRKSLSKRLSLRPTTVSFVVQELLEDRLIREVGVKSFGKPGRPELELSPRLDRCVVIAIYVESNALRGVLVNLGDQVLAETKLKVDPHIGNEAFLETCIRITDYLGDQIQESSELLGVAVSLVGPASAETKHWAFAARWPGIDNLDFAELESRTGLPVSLGRIHDSELRYLIETRPQFREGSVVLVHWGFGIGFTYSYSGRVLSSRTGEFGELGHTVVNETSERQCQCGGYGCLETEAALWALIPEIKERFPTIDQSEEACFDVLRKPGMLDLPAIRRATHFMTVGLLNTYRLLSPDQILIVGPFTENKEIFQMLNSDFHSALWPKGREQVTIEAVTGGLVGGSFGSALPFFRARLRDLLISRFR